MSHFSFYVFKLIFLNIHNRFFGSLSIASKIEVQNPATFWTSPDLKMFGKPLPPLLEHSCVEMGFGLISVSSPGVLWE